jgi:sugar lactone lactonase YvrE
LGSFGTEDGEISLPADVAIDASARVYITDVKRTIATARIGVGAIQVFHRENRFLAVWGLRGNEDDELSDPMGIGIDAHRIVLIAGDTNNRMLRFTPERRFLSAFGSAGRGPEEFDGRFDVVADRDGNFFVVDHAYSQVQVFNRNGQLLMTRGEAPATDPSGGNVYNETRQESAAPVRNALLRGPLVAPRTVALDSAGSDYVTDDSRRLIKFNVVLPPP